ncbi:MAG: hypothetical protein SFY66_03715 [Oculatellaceae cyanobacterium bins.114]|nr:hypothetical protein [Oculatellaceae cyanobacterium bins.114]
MPNSSQTTSNILIGIGTVPVLAVLLGSKAIAELMQHVGQASEELFRGDRLPILNLSSQPESAATDEPE